MNVAPPPLPTGFRVDLDPDTLVLADGRAVLGGAPRRLLRLTHAGGRALRELTSGPVRDGVDGHLARRLVSAGAAHPRPPEPAAVPPACVIVPVRDRVADLDRCLAAIGRDRPTQPGRADLPAEIVVVDDGSEDSAAVAQTAARHGARLVVRSASGGPAAARNAGLDTCGEAEIIAFVDSDCVPPAGWLHRLVAHFADPDVGAVAPRIVPRPPAHPVLAAHSLARSPLDMGRRPGPVRPGTRIPYVPTAVLVVRREALDRPAFDRRLRHGEDVDAVWRMLDAGWQVRYEPAVEVEHTEPSTWPAYLRRRFHYGASAGRLARLHPRRLAPAILPRWTVPGAILLLSGRPAIAAAATIAAAGPTCLRLARTLRAAGAPPSVAPRLMLRTVAATALGLGRAAAQVGLPFLGAAVTLPGQRLRRLAAFGALLAGPVAVDLIRRQPRVDPLRWTAACVVEDAVYGAGVWTGALRSHTVRPLLPAFTGPPERARPPRAVSRR